MRRTPNFNHEEPFPLEQVGYGEIIKVDNAKRQVFGWAYVTEDRSGKTVIDKSGEFTEYEELEKSAYQFVLDSRVGGHWHRRDAEDKPIAASTMIESMVFTPEKKAAMGIPDGVMPNGWWVGFQVTDERVWNAVQSGELRSFSVHGKGRKERVA